MERENGELGGVREHLRLCRSGGQDGRWGWRNPARRFLESTRQVLILPCVLSSVKRVGPSEVTVEKPPGQMDAADDMQ